MLVNLDDEAVPQREPVRQLCGAVPAPPEPHYIEGWYRGDVARMDRALHDDLAKRTPVHDAESDAYELRVVTKQRMLELTASGGGDDPRASFVITVDDISGEIASARTISPEYIDYLQLVKTPDGWKIANVLFRTSGRPLQTTRAGVSGSSPCHRHRLRSGAVRDLPGRG